MNLSVFRDNIYDDYNDNLLFSMLRCVQLAVIKSQKSPKITKRYLFFYIRCKYIVYDFTYH